jgi:hypothetical protein
LKGIDRNADQIKNEMLATKTRRFDVRVDVRSGQLSQAHNIAMRVHGVGQAPFDT